MQPYDLYQQVAERYHSQGKYQERDRFLVLALDAAHSVGQSNLAEQLRMKLLELNPNHLIKPYANCQAALQAQNFVTYLGQLRKNFPPLKAQSLLQELGGSPAVPRRKPTMLAQPDFPTADPLEERDTPTWSGISFNKPKPIDKANSPISYANDFSEVASPNVRPDDVITPFPVKPVNDPLANVPSSSSPSLHLQDAPTGAKASPKIEVVPAPNQKKSPAPASPAGIWVGNSLFLILFLASVTLFAYVFVLPYYPEVAKLIKQGW